MERLLIKQKVMRVCFWALLIYTALSSSMVWAIQLGVVKVDNRSISFNELDMREAAATFAKQFTREYFFWTQGQAELRSARLSKFWLQGPVPKDLFDVSKLEWNSYARHVDLWEIKEVGKNRYEVTVVAETLLTKPNNELDQKRVTRWLVVPLQLSNKIYKVTESPRLIADPSAG